jgi:hypothetical protein
MWDAVQFLGSPTLAVLISVLFVNFFIPIRTHLDHSLATAAGAGIVLSVLGLVQQTELVFLQVGFVVILGLAADFLSTFISFANRIRNAIVTTIVFVIVYVAGLLGLFVLIGPVHISPH